MDDAIKGVLRNPGEGPLAGLAHLSALIDGLQEIALKLQNGGRSRACKDLRRLLNNLGKVRAELAQNSTLSPEFRAEVLQEIDAASADLRRLLQLLGEPVST